MDCKHEGPYIRDLGEGARLRYEFCRMGKRILQYTVQLETFIAEDPREWVPVIRYDNWHGSPHRHVFRKDGTSRQDLVDIGEDEMLGYSRALKEAQADLRDYWELYCQRFKEGRWPV